MSADDRLIEPAYTSPITETRTTWKYRSAFETEFSIRNDQRAYVGIDKTESKTMGSDSDVFPMVCVFDDDDHDKTSAAFVVSLREECDRNKTGILEHPREGIKRVAVDRGTIRHNPAKSSAETIVSVTFVEQMEAEAGQQDDPDVTTVKALAGVLDSGADDFSLMTLIDNVSDRLAAIRAVTTNLNKIQASMGSVLAANAEALTTFNAIQDDILRNVGVLITSPAVLAAQMQRMIGTIADTPATFQEKFDAWTGVYKSVAETSVASISTSTIANRNQIANNEMVAGAAVANSIAAAVADLTEFKSKAAALDATYQAIQQVDELGGTLDAEQEKYALRIVQKQYFSQTDTYGYLKYLASLSWRAATTGINQIPATFAITLENDSELLNIVYKYHGTVDDDTLDRVIDNNNLTPDEIAGILKAGRELIL